VAWVARTMERRVIRERFMLCRRIDGFRWQRIRTSAKSQWTIFKCHVAPIQGRRNRFRPRTGVTDAIGKRVFHLLAGFAGSREGSMLGCYCGGNALGGTVGVTFTKLIPLRRSDEELFNASIFTHGIYGGESQKVAWRVRVAARREVASDGDRVARTPDQGVREEFTTTRREGTWNCWSSRKDW
jgi:hypothetical protein